MYSQHYSTLNNSYVDATGSTPDSGTLSGDKIVGVTLNPPHFVPSASSSNTQVSTRPPTHPFLSYKLIPPSQDALLAADSTGHTIPSTLPQWYPTTGNGSVMTTTPQVSPSPSFPPSSHLTCPPQNPQQLSNDQGHTVYAPRRVRAATQLRYNPLPLRGVSNLRTHSQTQAEAHSQAGYTTDQSSGSTPMTPLTPTPPFEPYGLGVLPVPSQTSAPAVRNGSLNFNGSDRPPEDMRTTHFVASVFRSARGPQQGIQIPNTPHDPVHPSTSGGDQGQVPRAGVPHHPVDGSMNFPPYLDPAAPLPYSFDGRRPDLGLGLKFTDTVGLQNQRHAQAMVSLFR
jgi:hypothetical protein